MPAKLEKWNPAWGKLDEQTMRSRLEAEGYSVARYVYPPGTRFPTHTHSVDKKDTVLKGKFRVVAEGSEFVLEPGDMLEIPAGTAHSAEVLGDEAVVSLDATKSAGGR